VKRLREMARASTQHAGPTTRDDPAMRRLRDLARASSKPAASARAELAGVDAIRREAGDMELLVQSDLARAFIHATADQPTIAPRTIYRTNDRSAYYTARQVAQLGQEQKKDLTAVTVGEQVYYTTKYGTPLAYARPLDLLGQARVHDV